MQEIVLKATTYLKEGKLILYPTDTVWGIGCDATNPEAVKKVYTLKQRIESKALICLVQNINTLKHYISHVPKEALTIIKNASKPTTIIYQNANGLAKNLIAEDGSIAMRIPKAQFCQELLSNFGRPIVSTSANIAGQPTPSQFSEIDPRILEGVDYIVPLQKDRICKLPSTLVAINKDGSLQVIRP